MSGEFYSVGELSGILSLHTKTVQRFIREGKIRGRKIGRAWRVHRNDLKDFAHAELRRDPPAPFPANDDPLNVSAVVELLERNPEEASRITNSIMAMLNCKDPSWGPVRYDMVLDPTNHKARFVLYGSPLFIAAMMEFFQAVRGEVEETGE